MVENTSNQVFIATSLDGYIADDHGGIEWLHAIPNPDQDDMGYQAFISQIDAIVMGRATYEVVCSFGIEWPYTKPVFVLSETLSDVQEAHRGKVTILSGTPSAVLAQIHELGFRNLYIDGGKVIQQFLLEDLIDKMIITIIPILLGKGISLFSSDHPHRLDFECDSSQIYLGKIVQNHFRRVR